MQRRKVESLESAGANPAVARMKEVLIMSGKRVIRPPGLKMLRQEVASAPPSTLLSSLKAYWKLDEASGTRADSSGNSNNLSATGTVSTVIGKVGNAIQSSITPTYLSGPSSTSLSFGDSDFEIAGWFKMPSNVDFTIPIFNKNDASGVLPGFEYGIIVSYDLGNIFWWIVGDSSSNTTLEIAMPSAGAWHFIDVYHDSVNNKLGVAIDGGAFTLTDHTLGSYSSTNPFVLGYERSGRVSDMIADELGIWGRLLTAAERTSLYNGGSGTTYPFS